MLLERNKEKLHRVVKGKKSDWEGLSATHLNKWQKVASRTHGVVTIGNATSLSGFILIIFGLYSFTNGAALLGSALILTGRLMDYFDGIAADMTKTKSSLGAKIDTHLDTIGLALALIVLIATDTIPLLATMIIILPRILGAFGYALSNARGKHLDTTPRSKVAAGLVSAGVVLFMFKDALGGSAGDLTYILAWVIMLLATALSAPTHFEYLRVGLTDKKQSN